MRGRNLVGSFPDIVACLSKHPASCWLLCVRTHCAFTKRRSAWGQHLRLIFEVEAKKCRNRSNLWLTGATFLTVRHCMKFFPPLVLHELEGVREMDQEAPVLADNLICLSQEVQIASVPQSKEGTRGAILACSVDSHWEDLGCAWQSLTEKTCSCLSS